MKQMMRKLKKYKPTKFMAKDSRYNKDAADFAVMFIESLCHTKGTWAGQPFELIDWQEQIIRDLFGILKPNGYRQFNTAYIEIPKKQGKSELAVAVALLLLCGDGEERAEVYGCAADRNQAKIVFDVAVDMVRFSPALSKRVKILESQKKITYLPTNSSYQVLSADVANKHGFNTHGVIFDELHTQPNRKLFDVMLQGSGDARMQPLYFLITTAGNDTNSICYEVHQLDFQTDKSRGEIIWTGTYSLDEPSIVTANVYLDDKLNYSCRDSRLSGNTTLTVSTPFEIQRGDEGVHEVKIALVCVASDESELTTIARQLASLENRVRQIEEGFANEIDVEEVIHGELAEMIGRIDSEVIAIPGTSGSFAVADSVHLELTAMLGKMTESVEGEIE